MPPRLLALLVVLAALWGGSFVFMRVAVPAIGPVPLAYARIAIAAIVLLVLAFAQRSVPPLRTRWRDFAVVGTLNAAIPFSLFSYAELHLTASAGAILNATSPFFAAIAAAAWLGEPVTPRKVIGMVVGFAGVVVLVGWHPGAVDRDVALAVAACLVAAMCYSVAGVYVKRKLGGVPSRQVAGASLLAAAVVLMPALPFSTVPGPLTVTVTLNVAALALASTALAYLIYFKLIAEAGPQRALTVTFLIPLFGVLWGAVFLGEPITTSLMSGGALVVAGTALALRK